MNNSDPVQLSSICGIVGELTGRTPAISTVKKWIRSGHRGVKLRVSGPVQFRFTTREWIAEFMAKCSNETPSHPVQVQSEESKRARENLVNSFGFKNLKGGK